MKQYLKFVGSLLLTALLALNLTACATAPKSQASMPKANAGSAAVGSPQQSADNGAIAASLADPGSVSGGRAELSEDFSRRELEQKPDLREAEQLLLLDGTDVSIQAEGVYVLEGSAKNVTVCVEAGDDDKIHLSLPELVYEKQVLRILSHL